MSGLSSAQLMEVFRQRCTQKGVVLDESLFEQIAEFESLKLTDDLSIIRDSTLSPAIIALVQTFQGSVVLTLAYQTADRTGILSDMELPHVALPIDAIYLRRFLTAVHAYADYDFASGDIVRAAPWQFSGESFKKQVYFTRQRTGEFCVSFPQGGDYNPVVSFKFSPHTGKGSRGYGSEIL